MNAGEASALSEAEINLIESELLDIDESFFDTELFESDEIHPVSKPNVSFLGCDTLCSHLFIHKTKFETKDCGLLKSGVLENYFADKPELFLEDDLDNLDFFGFNYNKVSLFFGNLSHGFNVLKQNISFLFEALSSKSERFDKNSFCSVRKDVVKFLNVIRFSIQKYGDFFTKDDAVVSELVESLNREISLLFQFLTHISAGSLQAWNDGGIAVHCTLDIYMNMLLVLDQCYLKNLDRMLPWGPDDFFPNTLSCLVNRVTKELINTSAISYAKDNAFSLSPFACPCSQELYLLMQRLLTHRNQHGYYQSFWSFVNVQLESKTNSWDKLISSPACFHLWLVTSWSQVTMDATGWDPNIQGGDNYKFCVKCLQTRLQNAVKESELRFLLSCFITLLRCWGPSNEAILTFWDHVFKDIMTPNDQGSLEMSSMMNLTSSEFIRRVEENTKQVPRIMEQGNTFITFCRLLGMSLNHSQGKLIWRKLKGRIFAKIYQEKVQELNNLGLVQLIYFFMTLSLSEDAADIVSRFSRFMVAMSVEPSDTHRIKIVWKALFCMLTILIRNNCNCQELMEKFRTLFVPYFSDFGDVSRKKVLSNMMEFYLTELGVFFDVADFTHGEYRLIGPNVFDSVPVLSREAIESFLNTFNELLVTIRYLQKRPHSLTAEKAVEMDQFMKALRTEVYPVMNKLVCPSVDPHLIPALAKLSASYTVSFGRNQCLRSMLTRFTEPTSVPVPFVYKYLSELLNYNFFASSDPPESEEIGFIALKGWIRCCVFYPRSDELTKLMVSRKCFRALGLEGRSLGEGMTLQQFFVLLRRRYDSIQLHDERGSFRLKVEKLLDSFDGYISAYIKHPDCIPDGIKLSYRFLSSLMQSCAPVIYTKGKSSSILHRLLKTMVLFNNVYDQSKSLTPEMSNGLKTSLHSVIFGVSELASPTDKYINRSLKDIILQYLERFVVSTHPFLVVLQPSDSKGYVNMASLIYEIMGVHYILDHNSRKTGAEKVKMLLLEALKRYQKNANFLICYTQSLFPIIAAGVSKHSEVAALLLKTLIQGWNSLRENAELLSVSQRVIEKMVDLYLDDSMTCVSEILGELSTGCPAIAVRIKPHIQDAVVNFEMKRGLEVHQDLRDQLRAFM